MVARYPKLVDESTGIKIQKAQKKNINDFAKLNFPDSSEVIERKFYKMELKEIMEIDYLTNLAIKDEGRFWVSNQIIGAVILVPIDVKLQILHIDIVIAPRIYNLGIASYVIHLLLKFVKNLGYKKVIISPKNNEMSNILKKMDFKTFELNSFRLNQLREDIRPTIVNLLLTRENLEIKL